jgi:hypothetical protein
LHGLKPDRAAQHGGEGDREDGEQQADAAVGQPRAGHRAAGSIVMYVVWSGSAGTRPSCCCASA